MSRREHTAPSIKFLVVKGCFEIIGVAIRTAGVVGIVYIIMTGLENIAARNPEQVGALAKVVDAFGFSSWLPWVVSIIMGVTAYVERKGKKRAIREKGRLQKIVEANDLNRESCGLTELGDTPEE